MGSACIGICLGDPAPRRDVIGRNETLLTVICNHHSGEPWHATGARTQNAPKTPLYDFFTLFSHSSRTRLFQFRIVRMDFSNDPMGAASRYLF